MRMWLSRRRDLWHALEDEIREVLRPSRIREVIKSSYGICVYEEEETEKGNSDENTPILEWFIERKFELNSLSVQGYYQEIKDFLDVVEGRSNKKLTSLEDLIPTFELLKNIKSSL